MIPQYIDTHCHMYFDDYSPDRDEVITRTLDADTWMINVGTTEETSRMAVSLAHAYTQGVYAIVGLHPVHSADDGEIFDYDFYKKEAADPKVVAIGECGLDYFRAEATSISKQKEIFDRHIELAKETKKPLMLHIRDAYKDAYDMLARHGDLRGNAHFFAGSVEEARLFLDLGFTLSFTGVITFVRDYDEVIRFTPLDRMLSETDSPFVAPAPFRGKRNEPLFVREVVKKIAEIKGISLEETQKALINNAFSSFSLGV